MSTYCISDIHGQYSHFMNLLDTVSPSDLDTIVVAGDIVDRGPETLRMLKWAMTQAPANVHFLIGNHEDMLASCIRFASTASDAEYAVYNHPWTYNVRRKRDIDWLIAHMRKRICADIADWIDTLPITYRTNVYDKNFLVVHAGIKPQWDDVVYWPHQDSLHMVGARTGHYHLGDPCGMQSAQDMLWARNGWYDRIHADPIHVVCGHTPNTPHRTRLLRDLVEIYKLPASIEDYGCCHVQTRHFIDCGSGYRKHDRRCGLGMLRLEDMLFFSEKQQTSYPDSKYLEWFALH